MFFPRHAPRVNASPFSIAILGNDAFLAAAPALPVQLMHAALAAGFNAIVPASLGDELVAGETLRLAQLHGRRPVVQCACPFSLSHLCKREANLSDVTIAVAPASVALARALRLQRQDVPHITYIGACPGAQDPAIDLQVQPEAFLRGLLQKGVVLAAQPDVFTDRLPPDRRRYLSLPGGAPRPDLVESILRRDSVTLGARMNPLLTIADALFDGGVSMIDPAGTYHCICAGAAGEKTVEQGRAEIVAMEPVRALAPIFEAPAWLDLRPTEAPRIADTPATPAAEPSHPVAFSDAAGIDLVPPRTVTARPDAPVVRDDAPYGFARELPTRQQTLAASLQQAAAATIGMPLPILPDVLHAPSLEREVPITAQERTRYADTVHPDLTPLPPLRRARTADDTAADDRPAGGT